MNLKKTKDRSVLKEDSAQDQNLLNLILLDGHDIKKPEDAVTPKKGVGKDLPTIIFLIYLYILQGKITI